jgi:hypothetical protein
MNRALHPIELAAYVRERHMPDGKGSAGVIRINNPFSHIHPPLLIHL